MRPAKHVAVSLGLTFLLSRWFYSWQALTACFLSGVLIDLDHFYDQFAHYKKISLRYRDMVKYCTAVPLKKLYVLLHAYEWLLILWWAIGYFHLGTVWAGAAAGLTVHLICDQFTNPLKPLGYFFIFRLKNNFDAEKILRFKYWKVHKDECKDTF